MGTPSYVSPPLELPAIREGALRSANFCHAVARICRNGVAADVTDCVKTFHDFLNTKSPWGNGSSNHELPARS